MAMSKTVSNICFLAASLISLVASQGAPAGNSLFNTLVNTQSYVPPPSMMDPSLGMSAGGAPGLGSLLSMNPMGASSFAPVTGTSSNPMLPPNFQTMAGGAGAPLGAMNSPAPMQSNPMSGILPYLLFSGYDMNNMMMMMMAMSGSGGGMFRNPLAMMLMGNQM